MASSHIARWFGSICCLLFFVLLRLVTTGASAQERDAKAAASAETANERLTPDATNGPRSETVQVTVVDEAGQPVANAAVRVVAETYDDSPVKTDASGTCRIPKPLPTSGSIHSDILAVDSAELRQGFLRWDFRDSSDASKPLRLVLKEAREVSISVTDKTGAEVDNALVVLLDQRFYPLAYQRTIKNERVRLRIPEDAIVESVIALKSKVGVDSWQARDDSQSTERRELPQELSFQLAGAQSVRVRAADSAGKPVPGIGITPTVLVRPEPLARIYVNHCRLIDTLTDENGMATIDWLPHDIRGTAVTVHSQTYFLPDGRGPLVEAKPNGDIPREATISLLRRTAISGKVTGADGKPMSGVLVLAQGHYHNGTMTLECARTGADGTYLMDVSSQHAYAVAVADEDWAAQSHLGIFVEEDAPVADLDFALTKGTVIRGIVTNPQEQLPAGKRLVQLYQIGDQAGL